MKMTCTDMAIRLEVDGLAMDSSASKKNWSLELLLTLHTVVGRHCVRRTAECSSTARARFATRPPVGRAHAHTSQLCARQGGGLSSRRAEPASLHSRMCRLTSVPRIYGRVGRAAPNVDAKPIDK